jgi:pimeloyl-ACP methyl ester carboxylesterase
MSPARLLVRLLGIPLVLIGASWTASAGPPGEVRQELVQLPSFVEPHTPGSGSALEMPASADVQSILGSPVNLNRVSFLRTHLRKPALGAPGLRRLGVAPPGLRPRAILILVPGFLGGAGTFSPLARQLVEAFGGALEVWAVDRRPNQLEDRRGSLYAQQRIAEARSPQDLAQAIEEATFFYVPEEEGFDVNQNGEIDPPFELPDAFGEPRSYVRLSQDDMRYAADWGVDTYVRDWKVLVDRAREMVGPRGLVLFGGHSQGTYWTGVFAAYDFDPDPNVVDAAYQSVDGLLLLEGGGPGPAAADAPDLAGYQSQVAALEQPGGPDVFLQSFQDIEPAVLGPGAEVSGLAAIALPDERSFVQKTTVFSKAPFSLFFNAPITNRGLVAWFVDDDFQPFTAFRASIGFTDDGFNALAPPAPALGLDDSFYVATSNGGLRTWKDYDDPSLPTCPPGTPDAGPGCAILDNGPRPGPDDPPARWGMEREVTDLDDFLEIQVMATNFIEWYFLSGRPGLDAEYGRDSSALVAESVAATGSEGPLVLTQNANVDVPVLCIGGSNGLAPTERSFARYLESIATPPEDREIHIIEGYAHLDMITAKHDEAVPFVADWIDRLLLRKTRGAKRR